MKKITSSKNVEIQKLMLLHQRKHRLLAQMFLIEGEHLVIEALSLGRITAVFINENYLVKLQKLVDKCSKVTITIVNETIIKKLSQNQSPQPIIGVCKIISHQPLLNSKNIILIDQMQDPGNFGTILRTAIAFNISEIYLSKTSVDLYNHKVVSASQGAIFHINVYYEDFDQLIKKLKAQDYHIYGTFLHEKNAINLPSVKFKEKNAILFGNEGQGINEKFKPQINDNIIIPTLNKVESLNLATSVAIVIYCLFTNNRLQ